MNPAIRFRQQIPFFYNKSEKEIQQDPYERFDPMVFRQSALHLADELWGTYPMQAILQFAKPHLDQSTINDVVEIGCGVGRWIAEIANQFPDAGCWGIDYSYQMLKRAQEIWIKGDELYLDVSRYGFPALHKIQKRALSNLQFGLAKAEALPFGDQTQDVVLSSFLLDRLEAPIQGLQEMRRVLKSDGLLIIITPLNFSRAKHWTQLHPPVKIYQAMIELGFKIKDWQENLIVEEPLDCRGNAVKWNCIALAAQKTG